MTKKKYKGIKANHRLLKKFNLSGTTLCKRLHYNLQSKKITCSTFIEFIAFVEAFDTVASVERIMHCSKICENCEVWDFSFLNSFPADRKQETTLFLMANA